MPLHTQILRDGKPLNLRWSHFHVAAMTCAAAFDSGQGPFVGEQKPNDSLNYPEEPQPINPGDSFRLVGYHVLATTPLNNGDYTLKSEHKFVDVTDGEILHLLPGDVLCATRHSK